MEIKTIKLKDCKAVSYAGLDYVCKKKNISASKIKNGYRYVRHVFDTTNKAELGLPCGSGKSISATTIIYERWIEMINLTEDAPEPNDIWLVVGTLEDGEKRYNELRGFGITEDIIGFFHSWWLAECKRNRPYCTPTYQNIVDDYKTCHDCTLNINCKSYKPNRRKEIKKSIVIMSHEAFIRLHEGNEIPPNVDIIIDEELINFFVTEIKDKTLNELQQHIPNHTQALQTVKNAINRLSGIYNKTPNQTVKLDICLTDTIKKQAIKDLKQYNIAQRNKDGQPYDVDLDERLDWHINMISAMGYALTSGFNIYAFADADEIAIARDRIHFNITNKVIMLNGSAECSRFPFDNMPIYKCPDLERIYSNIKLVVMHGSMTKNWLRKDEHIRELLDIAKDNIDGEVFVALNKSPSEEITKLLLEMYPDASLGHRIALIGLNDWRLYNNGIIAMSLFSKISTYALMASIRNNRAYSYNDIFKMSNNGKVHPNFKSNKHLANDDIDYELQIHAAYELHQTILRLSCREQSDKPVTVILVLPHVEIMEYLEKLMPGFTVQSDDKLFEFVAFVKNTTSQIDNNTAYDLSGLDSSNADHRERIEKIMTTYGYIKTKSHDKKGNHIIWTKAGINKIPDEPFTTLDTGTSHVLNHATIPAQPIAAQ